MILDKQENRRKMGTPKLPKGAYPFMKKIRSIRLFDWLETKYYNITIGIRNIFNWLPIIWRDRDWEYDLFTMDFILHKLKRLQNRPWEEIFVGGDWAKRYLNLCIWLIEEERRMENLEDDLWNSIEPAKMTTDEEPDEKGFYKLNFTWSSPAAEKKYRVVQDLRYIRQRKIHKLIYEILETRGSVWWD